MLWVIELRVGCFSFFFSFSCERIELFFFSTRFPHTDGTRSMPYHAPTMPEGVSLSDIARPSSSNQGLDLTEKRGADLRDSLSQKKRIGGNGKRSIEKNKNCVTKKQTFQKNLKNSVSRSLTTLKKIAG